MEDADAIAARKIASGCEPQRRMIVATDRELLIANPPTTLADIELTTFRMVAIRQYGGVTMHISDDDDDDAA